MYYSNPVPRYCIMENWNEEGTIESSARARVYLNLKSGKIKLYHDQDNLSNWLLKLPVYQWYLRRFDVVISIPFIRRMNPQIQTPLQASEVNPDTTIHDHPSHWHYIRASPWMFYVALTLIITLELLRDITGSHWHWQGLFHWRFFHRNSHLTEILIRNLINLSLQMFAHGTRVATPCVNICYDLIVSNRITVIRICNVIWIARKTAQFKGPLDQNVQIGLTRVTLMICIIYIRWFKVRFLCVT